MKRKHVIWFFVPLLAGALIALRPAERTAAQTQGTENLLINPGFEAGHHHQDGVPELTVPDGWRIHWIDGTDFFGSDGPAARPESVVWFIGDAPANEKSLFFRDGSYALKVFKGGRPMYAALTQDVNGLQVGRSYRLVVPIYIDIVTSYAGGVKVAPSKLNSGMVRLGASRVGAPWLNENEIAYSGWWTAETVSPFYLSYPIFVHDFVATESSMTIWIEFGSRHTYANNGFFLDTIGLYTLDGAGSGSGTNPPPANPPAAPGPSATPFPTPTPRADGAIVHIVQDGDSFWSLAIRYAPALNMTPEEALPYIRELNDNPAFLVKGLEILIAPPQTAAPEVEAVVESTAEPAADAASASTEEAAPVEPTATPVPTVAATEPAASPPEPVAIAEVTNAICVSVFDDQNGDGVLDAGEGLLADAVLTVSRPSGTVASYVSDGLNEPYCFEGLDSDTYQITFSQPPDYRKTTADNWAIAVSGGSVIPVQFGAQLDETALAAAQPEAETTSSTAQAVAESQDSEDTGGLASRLGTIALGIAVVLVVLAGVGIVLLRRG